MAQFYILYRYRTCKQASLATTHCPAQHQYFVLGHENAGKSCIDIGRLPRCHIVQTVHEIAYFSAFPRAIFGGPESASDAH